MPTPTPRRWFIFDVVPSNGFYPDINVRQTYWSCLRESDTDTWKSGGLKKRGGARNYMVHTRTQTKKKSILRRLEILRKSQPSRALMSWGGGGRSIPHLENIGSNLTWIVANMAKIVWNICMHHIQQQPRFAKCMCEQEKWHCNAALRAWCVPCDWLEVYGRLTYHIG